MADAEDAKRIYIENREKTIFQEVHLAYLSWQDILLGLDKVITISSFEERMIEDLKQLLE